MHTTQTKFDRPIRVVMFGSGPELTHDARQFLYRLEVHPEIELLGAFCQAQSQSLLGVIDDLWKRRGLLAIPLFAARTITIAWNYLRQPQAESALRKKINEISNRIHFVEDIHSQEVLDRVSSLEADLGLIYGSPILKPDLFEIPALGTLGIHHGKVPEYRGNKTTFWAMMNGEPAAGVTIQKVNRGLDTGSIVKTGEVPIGRRSYQTVVGELETLGLDLYIDAILEVKNGSATFQPQPTKKFKLYKNPKLSDFIKFWIKRTRRQFGNN